MLELIWGTQKIFSFGERGGLGSMFGAFTSQPKVHSQRPHYRLLEKSMLGPEIWTNPFLEDPQI